VDYFRNIVLVAAIAGVLAGLGMTVAQQLTTVPLILKAEVYEGEGAATPAHNHGGATAQAGAHEHGDGWHPANGFERTAFTLLANIVTGVGFALLLIAASELAGGVTGWRQGVFWGLAGFAVFTLAPGLGLPPELPAMPAAELGARQLWWVATVLSAAGALALIFYGRSPLAIVAAIALLVAPHLVTALLFWVLLGALAGLFRGRFIHAS
jgi:cobalt transporter subunit CbtA